MKTTLEIPDPTSRKAKATASALGLSITQAVEEKLSLGGRSQGKLWLECAGELAHLHKETIEPEDASPPLLSGLGMKPHDTATEPRQ